MLSKAKKEQSKNEEKRIAWLNQCYSELGKQKESLASSAQSKTEETE